MEKLLPSTKSIVGRGLVLRFLGATPIHHGRGCSFAFAFRCFAAMQAIDSLFLLAEWEGGNMERQWWPRSVLFMASIW